MIYTLNKIQLLKTDMDTLWRFMSSPKNLSVITPDYMKFNVLTDKKLLETMYPGQIIEYYVSPLLGIKLYWLTEITQVKHREYFIDEQRIGPYAFWHHKHFFKETPQGVEMTDLVHYKPHFGVLGKLANHLLITKQLESIFTYRQHKLDEIFNSK